MQKSVAHAMQAHEDVTHFISMAMPHASSIAHDTSDLALAPLCAVQMPIGKATARGAAISTTTVLASAPPLSKLCLRFATAVFRKSAIFA